MNPTELETAIDRLAREALEDTPVRLREAMLYSLLGPGKRIRPRLVIAVGEALGLPTALSVRIGTAVEMIHAYTLVHDDLPAMDDDDFRRGRPTNHKVYGEGLAVLAGDSLALLGPELILGLANALPGDRIVALLGSLLAAAGSRGVIAGQAAEMDLRSVRSARGSAALLEVFRKKTGALFRTCLEMPAIAAGSRPAIVAALGRLGDEIGIAFQIADDLEDDFAANQTDPGHIAAYLSPDEARAEGRARLVLPEVLDVRTKENLTPFLEELRSKLAGTAR